MRQRHFGGKGLAKGWWYVGGFEEIGEDGVHWVELGASGEKDRRKTVAETCGGCIMVARTF
jgi:hypothetical protein